MKLLACVLAMGAAFAQTPSSRGVNFYTVEKEIEFGKTVAAVLQAQVPVVHDATVDSYLQKLGRELRPADAAFEYRFVTYTGPRLEDGEEIVAVPGGTIFIPLRSVADATSETAIAAKIAHAIAHIELRHGTRQDTRLQMAALAMPTAQFPAGLTKGDLAKLIANSTTRQFEKDADSAAAAYMSTRQAGFEAAQTAARAALEN